MSDTRTNTHPRPTMPLEIWSRMVQEQLAKLQGTYEELGRYEKQSIEQAGTAIDELTRLMKQSLTASAEISAEWRKMALETTRRVGEMMDSLRAS